MKFLTRAELRIKLADKGYTISSVARSVGISAKLGHKAIATWQGKIGIPIKHTRRFLKKIEQIIEEPIYNEDK